MEREHPCSQLGFPVQQRRNLGGRAFCGFSRKAERRDVVGIGIIGLHPSHLPPGMESIRLAPDYKLISTLLMELKKEMARCSIEVRRKGMFVGCVSTVFVN